MRDLQRRQMLMGTAATAGMAGLAGCMDLFDGGDATDTGGATDRRPTVGVGSQTGSATVQPTRGELLAARAGQVVPVVAGGAVSPIDPGETNTPVGDAIDRVDEVGTNKGFGTVLLPPGRIQEAEPLVPTQFTRVLGWGVNNTLVEFTDRSSDGIRVERLKQGKFVTLDGFTLSGGSSDRRRGGSAIHFANDTSNPKHFNMGSVGFREWIDPVVHLEEGAPFGSRWEHLDFGFGHNDGREIVVGSDESLLGTQIGVISAGNRTGDPVLTTDFSGSRLFVGFINIGGSAGQAMVIDAAINGHIEVGGINFESGAQTSDPIVTLNGPASTRIGHVRNANGAVRSMVRLGRRNAHNVIGRLRNAGTVRRGLIEVTRQPSGPSFYFGSSNDFATRLDSLKENIVAFGDMQTADGTSLAGEFTPRTYDSPDAVATGELGVTETNDGPALVYRTPDGTVHRWTSDG